MVRGNLASGVFIIFNHGGPGSSAIFQASEDFFAELERDYALVFWDQRASGLSQGNAQPESLTLDDFLEDTDLLVDVVHERYAFAEAQLAAGRETRFWNDARDWIVSAPEPATWGLDEYLAFREYLLASEPYWYDDVGVKAPVGALIFASPVSFALLSNEPNLLQHFNILAFDFSRPEAMGQITLPSLFLWGADDGISPPDMGLDAFESVATNPADKQLVVYPTSAHSPHFEQTDAVVGDLRDFVETYR